MNKISEKLTTNNYWGKKYKKSVIFKRTHVIVPNKNLSLAEIHKCFKQYLPFDKTLKFIEVGCAPGGWMYYFNTYFGYQVEGIEYTESGSSLTRENLKALDIEAKVYTEDFLNNNLPKENYDVVFSCGFIEHFSNPTDIVQKHLDLLKSGGYLVMKNPNASGYNYKIQKLIDESILDKHNMDVMNIEYYDSLTESLGLEKIYTGYKGKINFGLFVGPKLVMYPLYLLQFLLSRIYFLFGGLLLKDRRDLSPYIVTIYKKK